MSLTFSFAPTFIFYIGYNYITDSTTSATRYELSVEYGSLYNSYAGIYSANLTTSYTTMDIHAMLTWAGSSTVVSQNMVRAKKSSDGKTIYWYGVSSSATDSYIGNGFNHKDIWMGVA